MDVINIKFISNNDNILLATCSVNCQVFSFDTNSCQFLWFFTTVVQFLFMCIFIYLLIAYLPKYRTLHLSQFNFILLIWYHFSQLRSHSKS